MDFLLDAFFLAFDDAWDIFLPNYLVPILSEEFGLCYLGHLVDFGDYAELFLEVVESLNPFVIFLLLVKRLIDLADVLEIHHVEFDVLGREGLFFRQRVEFNLGLGFLRLGFYR